MNGSASTAGAIVLAPLLVLLSSGIVQACQLDSPFPKPSWEIRINSADEVFVGHVVSIEPNPKPGWEDRVFFDVEIPIKGNVGSTFEAMQGSGGDCGIPFGIGDRVIFAGDFIGDPTVFLSDPPTSEQQARLNYLKTITEIR